MRKTTMALGLVACFVCGSAGAAVMLTQQPGQAPSRTGKELYRETERGPAYSLIEIPVGGQGFSSMVALLSAVYDIAKERGFAYAFAPTQAASISPAAGGAPAMAMMKVFMTRNREMPLRELLGADYSERAQEQFDREGWMSLSQLSRMFEAGNRTARTSDPLSDLIGVYSLAADGEPAFRVSKVGQDYFLESRREDAWGKPTRLVATTENLLHKLP